MTAENARYEPFPLNDIQGAYWFARSGAVNLGGVMPQLYAEVEIDDLDVDRLDAAVRRLLVRHEMLRAVVLEDGRQRILPEVPEYRTEVRDLTGSTAEEIESRLLAARRELLGTMSALGEWPPFRMLVARTTEGRSRVMLGLDLMVMDATSTITFNRELEALYLDPETELEPLEYSFRQYVLAEKASEDTEAYRAARDSWLERLDTLQPAPDLPLARTPGSLDEIRFESREAELDEESWRSLRERCVAAKVSPSAVLSTAYAETLAAWSRTRNFTLNVTTQQRLPLHPQVNQLIGPFTSVALLDFEGDGRLDFRARAKRTQMTLLRTLRQRRFGGIRVLRELARRRGMAAAAMPVVLTTILPREGGGAGFSFLERLGRRVHYVMQTPGVWLEHQVYEREGKLVLHWSGVDDLFPAGLLTDMFGAYRENLSRLANVDSAWSEPARPVPSGQLRRRQAINDTRTAFPEVLLHQPCLERAAATPDAPAVVSGGTTLSYGELRARSARLAHLLRDAGAQPNRLVGVALEKGVDQVVAVLGVVQAGAAYLPLDPDLPESRFRYLVDHGNVELLVTQTSTQLPEIPGVRRIEIDGGELEQFPSDPPQPAAGRRDLAYTIFTSGSTGAPKGVMIEHAAAANTILDVNRRFGVEPGDRVLALSALSFDLSVWDVFGALGAGATVVVPTPREVRDPAAWASLVEREGVTIWNSVPALMRLLVEHLERRGGHRVDSLRLVMMSGDWIPVSLPDRIRSLAPAAQVVSLGGATEASIWSIFHSVGEVDPSFDSIPYGRPMANQAFHVLDEDLEPRPDWVAGKLYIAGHGLARGYWRDEERTAASFFPHPRTGERLYDTGDVGRYLPDGDIEFLGREDTQVKVHGYRIELGEVESALEDHTEVAGGVVAAFGPRDGNRRLVGYYVPRGGADPGPAQLRSFLEERLPAYMVPQTFVKLDELPLTANGKVDRKALREPDRNGATAAQGEIDDSRVQSLCALVAEVLGIDEVHPEMSLADLGASSIDLVHLVTEAEAELDVRLELDDLFACATVRDVAVRCMRDEGAPVDDAPAAGPEQNGGAQLVIPRPSPSAPLRLVCVPYAGGGAHVFRHFSDPLGTAAEVASVQLPGRGARMKEPPLRSIAEMADALTEELRPQLDRRYVLLGYSMGALVAFETVRRLRRLGERLPERLLVAASVAPQLERPEPVVHALSDEHLRDEFARVGTLPARILDSPRVLAAVLPTLRADLEAVERYAYSDEAPLPCPIAAYAGEDDALVARSALEAWRAQTDGEFAFRLMPGDHFFVHSAESAFVDAVRQDLDGRGL
ncbi:MAG: non-ribosomal peptide synthetase [Gaiellaceae bacterium]